MKMKGVKNDMDEDGNDTPISRLKQKVKCLVGIHKPRTITTYYNEAVVTTTRCKSCKKELGAVTFIKPIDTSIKL